MVNQTTFGRRSASPRPVTRATETHAPASNFARNEKAAEHQSELLKHIASPPIDDEFREWKKARQLALMASVSFGVASLVLPDSVGDTLDWVLYGLMAASAYAGLQRRWGMASKN